MFLGNDIKLFICIYLSIYLHIKQCRTHIVQFVRCAENKKLVAANSVLIIGGGPVGVELAGEIAVDFPTKKVMTIHKEENAALKFILSIDNEAGDES